MTAPSRQQLRFAAESAMSSGQIDAGIAAYGALLAQHPDGPDDWYNLAYLQRCANRFDDALTSYGEALRRGVSQPEAVHVNRAAILSDHLADDVAAEAELRIALELAPTFVVASLNLANIYEDRGDRQRAREMYRRVLDVAPTNGRAMARLAMLDVHAGAAAAVVPVLQDALTTMPLTLDDAGEIGFALGHALDALGRYEEAFAAFAAANVSSRSAAPWIAPYDELAFESLITRIIAAFPVPAQEKSTLSCSPIFICGMFRSGSTLAEQIISRHPRVTAGGELDLLPSMIADRLPLFPEMAFDLPSNTIDSLRQSYVADINRIFPDRDRVTDKRPDNFLYIGLIKSLFPAARIVHTVRQDFDNALSIYFLNFDPSISYGFDLNSIGHYYRQYSRLMAHWARLYPDDIHDFDYDHLVRAPEVLIPSLVAACDLPWDPACLQYRSSGVTVRTASTWQVRQPLHTKSSGRWRNYEAFLAPLRAALDGR